MEGKGQVLTGCGVSSLLIENFDGGDNRRKRVDGRKCRGIHACLLEAASQRLLR